jgi:hypothetical protein
MPTTLDQRLSDKYEVRAGDGSVVVWNLDDEGAALAAARRRVARHPAPAWKRVPLYVVRVSRTVTQVVYPE